MMTYATGSLTAGQLASKAQGPGLGVQRSNMLPGMAALVAFGMDSSCWGSQRTALSSVGTRLQRLVFEWSNSSRDQATSKELITNAHLSFPSALSASTGLAINCCPALVPSRKAAVHPISTSVWPLVAQQSSWCRPLQPPQLQAAPCPSQIWGSASLALSLVPRAMKQAQGPLQLPNQLLSLTKPTCGLAGGPLSEADLGHVQGNSDHHRPTKQDCPLQLLGVWVATPDCP